MNRRAFDLALRAGLALNCQINRFTKWDRKNYFYPDLPKNFQISQYDLPFSHDGWLEINVSANPKLEYAPKRIGIIRAHLEEDAGKLIHDDTGQGGDTLVDLNRAGTPLLEIVSQPEINSPEETVAYLTEMRLLMRELGVSDCEMQEGSLRCDANINLHIPQSDGSIAATPIVEVKNLNSFRAVERAMRYEANRQFEEFQKSGRKLGDVPKATAGWDDVKGVTRMQRRKEEASDYRYFPDPDLLPIVIDDAWLERIRSELGELPSAQRQRLSSKYRLSIYDADVLVRQGRSMVDYFEAVTKATGDAKSAGNWIINKLLQVDDARNRFSADRLAGLIQEQKAMGLTKQMAEEVFDAMLMDGSDAKTAIARLGITALDESTLIAIVRQAIADNPKAVEDYKKGKIAALQKIKGAVMKATKGVAKPDVVDHLLAEALSELR